MRPRKEIPGCTRMAELTRSLGWSLSALANLSRVSDPMLLDFMLQRRLPKRRQADRIQAAFGKHGMYFDVMEEWPTVFYGGEVLGEPLEGDALEVLSWDRYDNTTEGRAVEDVLDTLTQREHRVVAWRFLHGYTLLEIANCLAVVDRRAPVTHSRVGQILKKALRKLKHPTRIEQLSDCKEWGVEKYPPPPAVEVRAHKRGMARPVKPKKKRRYRKREKEKPVEFAVGDLVWLRQSFLRVKVLSVVSDGKHTVLGLAWPDGSTSVDRSERYSHELTTHP